MYSSVTYFEVHFHLNILHLLDPDMAEEDAFGQELRLRRRELRHMEHEDVLSFIQTQVGLGELK